jgi:hypothetical protein
MAPMETLAPRARRPRKSRSVALASPSLQQENSISRRAGRPALGVHPSWGLHHQGSLLSSSEPTGTRNKENLEQGLESGSLAQNLHLSLAGSAQQNPDLGQPP